MVVRVDLGDISQTLRLPRALATQHLALEMPRIPSWLLELVEANDLAASYSIELADQDYEAIARMQEAAKRDRGGYGQNSGGSPDASASLQQRQAVLEAASFHQLVETAAAAIDGAAILRAQTRITEALLAPVAQRGTLRRQWQYAQDRLLCAWRLVESAGRAPSFSDRTYGTAVEALAATSDYLPDPLATAAKEASSLLRDRPGRLAPGRSDIERLRIAYRATERLLDAKEVVRIRFSVSER